MKKIFIILICLIFSFNTNAFGNTDNIAGRWTEKTSERIVADIYPDKSGYQIYITWREDNLAQKDIYRFTVKPDKYGNLKYKNGVHIYRYYDSKNNFEDKVDYLTGSGEFKIKNNELIWIDNKANAENTNFIRANKDGYY